MGGGKILKFMRVGGGGGANRSREWPTTTTIMITQELASITSTDDDCKMMIVGACIIMRGCSRRVLLDCFNGVCTRARALQFGPPTSECKL